MIDPMRPNNGPTATAPRQAERETRRDVERAPDADADRRFGLPPVSGPLPPLLPPLRRGSVLQQRPAPCTAPPPPTPSRARQRRPRQLRRLRRR
jgi:hypothetical protein